jgi:hypothetical protein
MSSIPIATRAERHPHLRPLNKLRDPPDVADLIELCFSSRLDSEGPGTGLHARDTRAKNSAALPEPAASVQTARPGRGE